VLTISGRGTVVTGEVERGVLAVGEAVDLVGPGAPRTAVVTSIESFHKQADRAEAGDNAALLLRGVRRGEVARGDVLAAPGSITPHTRCTAALYVLRTEEGGRHRPFATGYRPQFYFRTTDVNGTVLLADGAELALPGDTVRATVELSRPVALEPGLGFAVREGGRTVAAGTVVDVLG
jgi:elongation factor Tu